MEAVDSEVFVTCMDLGHVRKVFQLALLCTKRHPMDRPTMHEVALVLVSLLPAPSVKPCVLRTKAVDYSCYLAPSNTKMEVDRHQDSSSSDGKWFLRFGEVISKSTL